MAKITSARIMKIRIPGIKMNKIIELLQIFGQKNSQLIKSIYLFGSIVRGDYTNNSDLDVLIIIAEGAKKEIRKRLDYSNEFIEANRLFSKRFIEGITPLIETIQGLAENFDPLPQTILREGLLVFGEKIETLLRETEIKVPEKPELKKLINEIKQAFY